MTCRPRWGILGLWAFAFLLPSRAEAQSPGPPTPTVVMQDQFERRQELARLRGDVIVLLYGDRKSADANKQLGAALHIHFHPTARGLPPSQARQAPAKPSAGQPAGARAVDVHAIPVACIGKVPAVVKKLIAGQFRTASPDVPILLDFDDQMRREFDFTPGVPNVAVFDAQGRYRQRLAGALTREQFEQLLALIEELRREALQTR